MLEARYLVPSITTVEKKVKPALVSAGAMCRGWYGLTDIMFGPAADYNSEFVRLRIARKAHIPSFAVTLTHKKTIWGLYSKADTIILQKEFGDTTSADAFIETEFSNALKRSFAFCRDGIEYVLGDLRIFVEDIFVPSIRWSVEIEGPNDASIAGCAETLGLGEPICNSVPALVQQYL
ncbi:MAG: hypothetical protein HY006_03080 [Candidatus Sungbacteria bacterium]|nr:hypothetical protein [Candidatus Sungbacteria bacterium]